MVEDQENVVTVELRGVSDSVEERLHSEENLAGDLFDEIGAVCDELDIDAEGFSISFGTDTVSPPIPTHDGVPVDPLDEWEGGAVEHTGGGIFCRVFRHPEKHLEVIYHADYPEEGVSLAALTYDSDRDYWFNNGDVLENVSDVDGEQDAVEVCRELMGRVNDGVYDDRIASLRET